MKNLLLVLIFLSVNAVAFDQIPPKPLSECKAQAPYGMPTGKTGVGIWAN